MGLLTPEGSKRGPNLAAVTALPMFPLGTVLFPSLVLPLHVFEERYRALTRACLDGDREFGVVLIERGSEVGGGDVRTTVGTVARIVEAEEYPDGRFALVSVGVRRIRVDEWLPDDPYPRAEVHDWPDPEETDRAAAAEALADMLGPFRRSVALKVELGESSVPATIELDDDPAVASFQAAAVGPLGPLDQRKVLATEGAVPRLELLAALFADEAEVLAARLSG